MWIPSHKYSSKVISEVAPESYNVQISQGTLRRNRRQLIASPPAVNDELEVFPDILTSDEPAIEPSSISEQSSQPLFPLNNETVRTRTGRTFKPPQCQGQGQI